MKNAVEKIVSGIGFERQQFATGGHDLERRIIM